MSPTLHPQVGHVVPQPVPARLVGVPLLVLPLPLVLPLVLVVMMGVVDGARRGRRRLVDGRGGEGRR